MKFVNLVTGTRSATFEIQNGCAALSPWQHRLYVDGHLSRESNRNVLTIDGLASGTQYHVSVESGGEVRELTLRTATETCRMDAREFGAIGDGRTDDTGAIQAALCTCLAGGVVEIPQGDWLCAPLFLKSETQLWLAQGARLVGHPDIDRWPILPPMAGNANGSDQVFIGTWEGDPAVVHAGLINGIGVHDVCIFGRGCIDANASFATWWSRPKQPFRGWRPRTVYLVNSERITLAGLSILNSPSWTVHALRCRRLTCVDLTIESPVNSPNTDGINPESCENTLIAGARISTGDDCIAIKSGKTSIAAASRQATRDVSISNCIMGHGHGAVTIGSEMSGGVYDVTIRDCLFQGTERGLRIKTRRGRGATGIVDNVLLQNVKMERVDTPLVINSFYSCGPEEQTEYAGDRRALPIDDGTPTLRNIRVSDVTCEDATHSAGFMLGLPERPIEGLTISRYRVRFDPEAVPGFPDKARGIEAVARSGLYLCNVRAVVLEDIQIQGANGPCVVRENAE